MVLNFLFQKTKCTVKTGNRKNIYCGDGKSKEMQPKEVATEFIYFLFGLEYSVKRPTLTK